MREIDWQNHATASELRSLEALEIQMAAVREKISPHRARLRELGEQRHYVLNKVKNRAHYWRRKKLKP